MPYQGRYLQRQAQNKERQNPNAASLRHTYAHTRGRCPRSSHGIRELAGVCVRRRRRGGGRGALRAPRGGCELRKPAVQRTMPGYQKNSSRKMTPSNEQPWGIRRCSQNPPTPDPIAQQGGSGCEHATRFFDESFMGNFQWISSAGLLRKPAFRGCDNITTSTKRRSVKSRCITF